jgi:uncharacterized membrane protein
MRTYSRLWTPVIAGIGGTAISLAVGLGQGKWLPIVIGESATAIAVVILYLLARSDSDLAAVVGHRADERQELVRLKASRVTALVAVIGSVVACVIAAAMDATYWPFEVLYILPGLAYLISVQVYGARDGAENAEDDVDS